MLMKMPNAALTPDEKALRRFNSYATGRWLSADPAMGDYIPSAPINEEARRRNGNLPGMGGVFNYVNLHAYHYAGNNPVKYTDPDGETPEKVVYHAAKTETKQSVRQIQLFNSLQTQVLPRDSGYNKERAENACVVLTLMDTVQVYTDVSLNQTEITSLIDSFYTSGYINSNNDVQGKPGREGILNTTLDVISYKASGIRSPFKAVFEEYNVAENASFVERRGNTRRPPFRGGIHSQLGTRDGEFLHDPWSGGINRNDPELVFIRGSIIFSRREE
jgi:hypothetical protein